MVKTHEHFFMVSSRVEPVSFRVAAMKLQDRIKYTIKTNTILLAQPAFINSSAPQNQRAAISPKK